MASLALVSVMHMRLYHMLSVLHTPHLCVDEPHPPGRTEIVRVRLIGHRLLAKATVPFVWSYGMEPIIPLSNVEDTYTNTTTVSFIPAPDGCRPTGWCRSPASRTTTIPVLVLKVLVAVLGREQLVPSDAVAHIQHSTSQADSVKGLLSLYACKCL